MEIYSQEVWFQFLIFLSRYIDTRISHSGRHSAQVAQWARSTAEYLECGLEEIQTIFYAALLHDVGKIGVPDSVLVKAGPLTPEEWGWMRLHPTLGSNMVQAAKLRSQIAAVIIAHQEKVDGTGYPNGLLGDQIPLGARILSVVDAYDAMTSDRVYRRARTHQEAITELQLLSGQHFDTQVVHAFMEVVKTENSAVSGNGRYDGNGSHPGNNGAVPRLHYPTVVHRRQE